MTPVGDSLLTSLYIDIGIQALAFAVSAPLKTERFYDLSGSLDFLICTLVALLWRRAGTDRVADLAPRQIVVAVLVITWAVRLGGFLALRVAKTEDKRFEAYKQNPIKFAPVWFMQAVWIYLTAFAAFIVLANPSHSQASFGASDIIGVLIWVYGFTVEVTADVQKYTFKNAHPHEFIRTGIWRYSRYANYNGEISLWIGMFVLCARGLDESWQWVAIISPLFVAFLVVRVSGIRLSEKAAQERYGSRPDYQAYKARTSTFFLWPPKRDPSPTLAV
ncbi:hypothetical protein PhCBS80983_g01222 [Powellomyces hirtus]|uniref:Uncharacterized protein n=1 Tax=Powellomyces hirtus TaxID=109895 RepID=A0A507EDT1_9FUNG|nr:hypothetical protein PhCBS80983_g01222 [Powellomyces hirtus]